MGRYRARDLLLVPNLISLLRLPLGGAFVLAVDRPWLALSVLIASGLSDVLDGWWARKNGLATPTGAVVDPVTDKLFVLVVVLSLIEADRLPALGVPLLAARELGELPLVVRWILSSHRRHARAAHPMANVPGKLATSLQFATVAAALVYPAALWSLLIATGLSGALAAAAYWRRELTA